MDGNFQLYRHRIGLTLGFHGCDESFLNDILLGKTLHEPSRRAYDWLGSGIYFWENNPERALQFALEKQRRGEIENPTVVGAYLDLGYCLDFTESKFIELLKFSYNKLHLVCNELNEPLPQNSLGNDRVKRYLDCSVVETLHASLENDNEKPFDSVRGIFWEGEELYPNAGFRSKNHIQICVRNLNCVKGYFQLREADRAYFLP